MSTFQRWQNLDGKVAVITGAIGQVGYATSIRLAKAGCKVIGIVRSNVDEAVKKYQMLPNQHLGHFIIEADITNTATLKPAAEEVSEKAGKIDILVNSAGISSSVKPDDIQSLTDELFDSIIISNLRGPFSVIREFISLIKKSQDGIIINISSTSGQRASASNLAYGASKAGLDLLTKSLAKVIAPEVRIVSVVPGHMVTPTSGATKGPAANDKMAAATPLKRIGYADDIASTVEALCTHIRFATGSVFLVDGGRTL